MTAELAAEGERIARELSWLMRRQTLAAEVPIRIHSRDTDAGGSPELHHQFTRWIGAICICGRAAVCASGCRFWKDKGLGHLADCEPACRLDSRFFSPDHKNHPSRLKRALRQVRRLNPKAYDLVYLIVALSYSWDDAMARLNADHLSRGQVELTEAEYAVLWVSGASLLTSSF
jgi:hypothetical protein